jgi:hypothetical protein
MVSIIRKLSPVVCSVALLLLAQACTKEAEEPETNGPPPPPDGPLMIVAGDDGYMEVTTFDTVFVNSNYNGTTRELP